jgi:hypothetical protein
MTTTEFGTEFANIFGRLSAVEGTQPEDDIHQRLVEDIASSGARNLLQELGGGEPDIKSEFENALQGALTGQIDRSEIFTTTQSAYENRETAS